MMNNAVVLTLLCLSRTVFCWIGHVENTSKLITRYIEHCGSESVCSVTDEYNVSSKETLTPRGCPACSCTDECDENDICCPDISVSTCVQTKYHVNYGKFIGEKRFKMVTSCPQMKNSSMADSCIVHIDHTNFLHQSPVFSIKTNKTYINIQCSKCHGENQIIPWVYYFSCNNIGFDPDSYSNTAMLWMGINQYDCSIDYTPPRNSTPAPCVTRSLVGECNTTGYWDEYDKDIEFACKNYWNQYGVFQNVFCFLCNIGAKQRNEFPAIENYDDNKSLNHCRHSELKKNCTLACEECFHNTTPADDGVLTFTDAWLAVSEEYDQTRNIYLADITVLSCDVTSIVENMLLMQNPTKDVTVLNDGVNLTSLYEEYVRSGGYQNWCHRDHQVDKVHPGFRARRHCLCGEDCYRVASCCPDAAYHQHRRCTPAFLGQGPNTERIGHSYYMISKCPISSKNTYLKDRCETLVDYDLFNIPVINVQTKETYKNVYCAVCHNQNDTTSQKFHDFKLWNVSLVCPRLLFPLFMSSMEAILRSAEKNNCSIYFTSTNIVETCTLDNDVAINKCNVTGMAMSVSESARRMCEEPTMNIMAKSRNYIYKNQICDMCNSAIYEDPISKCYLQNNLKRNSNPTFLYYCEHGDDDIQYYPFRNIFCKQCNLVSVATQDSELTYREIFAFVYIPNKVLEKSSEQCVEGYFKDVYENKCRELFCSRGKILKNNSCHYLVPNAQKAQYNVAWRVSISSNSKIYTVFLTLEYLQKFIQHEIHEGELQFDEQYVYSDKSCEFLKLLKPNATLDDAIIYLRITITNTRYPFHRMSLESHLLNFTRLSINFENVSLHFKESLEAWFLPILVRQQASDSSGCHIKIKNIFDTAVFAPDVNTLLTCTQIELSSNEYVYNEDYSSIYVARINKNFKINEFLKSKNGSVRICSNSYQLVQHSEFNSVPNTSFTTVLMVLTYISTIFSLLSLLLTFLIYCILSILRTIPGKNIMCFVFSLFFAQLFFLIRTRIDDKTFCTWVGGLTHYFWLSVFTCTNICCFHMFRSFVRNSLVYGDKSSDRKLFIRYILVAFSLPVLPIVINLILESFIDSDSFGYGGSKCFLVSSLALLLLFILPLILQIVFNIVMFSFTYHNIRTTPRVQSSRERNEFSIFLKLFLLTGISWILMIVDGFFEVSPFTYLATIINGSQGIFLFISYVCNKKVFIMLKNRLCNGPRENVSTNTKMTFL
ncbi:uncharacterized protein LOC125668152 [Ostrea edulis]|uniref:uncharacterized protein LOC125668152 n=1 Tax=Ostrea edulis TaxID=37623 RepID=UPI0024AEB916|nr:uncharacterized protein LOC125668152 [Ostrea edulis]